MKVQVGSGNVRLPGFLNVDIRRLAATDLVGHAGDLRTLNDGSVDVLFSHTVFEHIFVKQQAAVLREWGRVLSPTGWVVCLGLPDFRVIARLYLDGAPGVVGGRFDLFNVYRYTHGEPESSSAPAWSSWKPDASPNAAPNGWLPQLHKGLFDGGYLKDLFESAGFDASVFNYAYPGEDPALNLGCVACVGPGRDVPTTADGVRAVLAVVPRVERFVNADSITVVDARDARDSLLEFAARPDPSPVRFRTIKAILNRMVRRPTREASVGA